MEEQDFYRTLQVDPGASPEIIAEAYWALVRKTQTRRGQGASDSGRLNRLNVAYANLISPDLRSSYDVTLQSSRVDGGAARAARGGGRPSLFARLFRSRGAGTGARSGDNCYRTLQVDPEAEPEVIAAAYGCLRRQLGEELWQGVADDEEVDKLAEAFAVLRDPERRAEHDARLFGRGDQKTSVESPAAAVAEAAGEEEAEREPEKSAPVEDKAEVEEPADTGFRRRLLPLLVAFIVQAAVVAWRIAVYAARRTGRALRWFGGSVLLPAGRWLRSTVVVPAWRWLGERLSRQPSTAPGGESLAYDPDSAIAARLSPLGTAPLTVHTEAAQADADPEQGSFPMASLVVQGGPDAGAAFIVTDRPISLGADPQCDVILEATADEVAPVHVRIWHREQRFMIHRIANNGTILVNGRPITWGVLEDGDQLRIGQHQLTFTLAQEDSAHSNGERPKAKGEVS